jgi:hypothetical protein
VIQQWFPNGIEIRLHGCDIKKPDFHNVLMRQAILRLWADQMSHHANEIQ